MQPGRCAVAVLLLLMAQAGWTAGFAYRPVGIKIYQAEDIVRARVPGGPVTLGPYVHGLSHVLRNTLTPTSGEGFGAALVMIIQPGQQVRHWLVTAADLSPELVAEIERAVATVPAPTVQDGPLAFALKFEARGGGPLPDPAEPELPTPAAWQPVLGGAARFPMQDADLAKLWDS
jgi:hypothetical protein